MSGYGGGVAPPDAHGQSSSDGAAVLKNIADAVARAQAGERVIIQALGVAVVPASDLDALALTDDEVEDAMIELDRGAPHRDPRLARRVDATS